MAEFGENMSELRAENQRNMSESWAADPENECGNGPAELSGEIAECGELPSDLRAEI